MLQKQLELIQLGVELQAGLCPTAAACPMPAQKTNRCPRLDIGNMTNMTVKKLDR